jgi:orotate phosphoribosyltransferase
VGSVDSAAVANMLVESEAIAFRTDPPFRFTSGTISPIYVDNRLLLGFVDVRRKIVAALAEAATATDRSRPFEAVAGTATAGIPWAAWLAESLDVPLMYVRSSAKGWGHQKSVEGVVSKGWRTLLVEDLLYTAGSARSSIANLRDAGVEVDTCACIVTYDMPSARSLSDLGVTVAALTTVDEALDAAVGLDKLAATQKADVMTWLSERRQQASAS